jgi:dihydroorotate dehydrogenase (NAD+) catalytic subunit
MINRLGSAGRRRSRMAVDLTATVGATVLTNPVMTAAGTAGHGAELVPYGAARLGAIVVKSMSRDPWDGNPAPRLRPVDAGMLNAVGLQNPGVDHWLDVDLPALSAANATVVASVWGFTISDYEATTKSIASASTEESPVAAIEVNVSCPNLEDRRHMFGHSASATHDVISACVAASPEIPIWAKLSPNVTDLSEIAGAALDAGAAALTLTNTVMGLVIDVETRKPALANGGGGLSGPAIRPVAVRAVFEMRKAFPHAAIVGVGGITRGEHAVEFLMAGANAVQVGTASFYDPHAPVRILDELTDWCRSHRVRTITELIGAAHP